MSTDGGEAQGAGPSAPPAKTRILGRALNATIVHAPFLWPLLRARTRAFWERAAPGWDARDRNSAEYLTPLAAALLHVRPEPERALDIGTGTGPAALLVAREFPRASVRGVDISEQMVRRAQARIGLDPEGRVAFKVGDASSLPFEDEAFDLTVQLNMPPFLGEIARVLRPGGHAIVAASWGRATPFYTPEPTLRRGFARRGMEQVEAGTAGRGSYFVARLPA